jgi:hypothetical protein
MNSCCFQNHVLYPFDYDGPAIDDLLALARELRLAEVDAEIDEALVAEGIDFDQPSHIVHFLGRDSLLHILEEYAALLFFGVRTGTGNWDGTPVTELTTTQLKKIVLLAYEREFGGTLVGLDDEEEFDHGW